MRRPALEFIFAALLLVAPTSLLLAQSNKPVPTNPPAPQRKQPGQARPQEPNESINGRLVGPGGRPVAGAAILAFSVNLANQQDLMNSLLRPVTSDANGKFELAGVQPGAYTIVANSPGLILSDSDSARYYRPGDTITLTLVKGGVITGRVTNSSGESLVGASVRTVKIRELDNKLVRTRGTFADFNSAATAILGGFKTDDRGIYRIFGLTPGYYQVSAGGSHGFGFVFGGGAYDSDSPTYFPSSTIDTAGEVMVKAGDEITGIDIRYRDHRGHSISGRLAGSTASIQQSCTIQLTRASGGMVEATTYVLSMPGLPSQNEKGFAFNAVMDGEYFVAAIAGDGATLGIGATLDVMVSPARRVTVSGGDVTGIELTLEPLASIAGRAVLEPLQAAAQKAECKGGRSPRLEEIVISAQGENKLKPEDFAFGPLAGARDTAPAADGGEFSLAMLRAGVHRIDLQFPSENLYFKSATLPPANPNSKPIDAARNGVVLKSGDKLKGMVVTISEGAAGLRGRVVAGEENKPPEAKMRVHLVPAEPETADEVLRYFESSVDEDGAFSLTNLAPGKYWLVAREISEQEQSEAEHKPVAWDAGGRMGLRFEGDASKKVIELAQCQRVTDFVLSYKPLIKPSKPPAKKPAS